MPVFEPVSREGSFTRLVLVMATRMTRRSQSCTRYSMALPRAGTTPHFPSAQPPTNHVTTLLHPIYTPHAREPCFGASPGRKLDFSRVLFVRLISHSSDCPVDPAPAEQ